MSVVQFEQKYAACPWGILKQAGWHLKLMLNRQRLLPYQRINDTGRLGLI